MGFFDKFFVKKSKIELAVQESTEEMTLAQNFFALQTGINLLASYLAGCEFQTLHDNRLIKEDEYYLWNVQPNPKQNKIEFINQAVSKLVWNNECLIIEQNGSLYVAESYSRQEYAFFPDVFKNITVRGFTLSKTFYEDDVIFLKLNDKDITVLLNGLLAGYKRLISMSMAKYKRAGGRKGVYESGLNPQNSKEWNEALADLYGDRFRKYFNEENALVVIPEGQKYTEISGEGSKKSTSDVTDFLNLKDEVYTEVARALKIHPSLLKGNVSELADAIEFTLTNAVKPLAKIFETEITAKRYGKDEYIKGNYMFVNTSKILYVTPFKVADKADKLIADTIYNADEIRERLGDAPLNSKASTMYRSTKNYENAEGGETNGNN